MSNDFIDVIIGERFSRGRVDVDDRKVMEGGGYVGC